jgi:hypothetical protein
MWLGADSGVDRTGLDPLSAGLRSAVGLGIGLVGGLL